MDAQLKLGRPPTFGGHTSVTSSIFHSNRQLDDDRQMFIRKVNNQTLNQGTNRRSSTGFLPSLSNCSRFRRLHRLHYESLGVGLNDASGNCLQTMYTQNRSHGLLFRASLPATPISTPIHKDFQPFTEQLLFDRLCRTPSPARRAMHWDANNNDVQRDPRLDGRIGLASLSGSANPLYKSLGKLTIDDSHQCVDSSTQVSSQEPFDVDELSESDIGTTKGLRLALHLNSRTK
jgi:hypothetical protein